MEIAYFSWLKNRVGTSKESISLPAEVKTLKDLIEWLVRKENKYQVLSSYASVINVSVNGSLVEDLDTASVKDSDNVSFFSPMAGG